MEKIGVKIDILPNYFLNENGTFNKEEAILLCGKIAGVCYDKEGFKHLENEPIEKTERRVNMTLHNGHHSVYDHITINFNIQKLPKILAMVLNNEHEYTTSEKSARYTKVEKKESPLITEREEYLYNKWLEIFFNKIKERYSDNFKDTKIKKLAQENARYLVSVFMPTEMIYSTSLRQINYVASFMTKYINNANMNNPFEAKLAQSMHEFISELSRLNVLEKDLMTNDKFRSISLFGNNLNEKEEHFGDIYSTTYKASLAYLAQAQRHRTLDYQMEFSKEKEFYIPPIIEEDNNLTEEWLTDINSVAYLHPQGELVNIWEEGKYTDFILKCKERLCSAAQLEICDKTREILLNYRRALEINNHPLKRDIVKYSHGARCTFPDFVCKDRCDFKEGKTLTRKV